MKACEKVNSHEKVQSLSFSLFILRQLFCCHIYSTTLTLFFTTVRTTTFRKANVAASWTAGSVVAQETAHPRLERLEVLRREHSNLIARRKLGYHQNT